MPLENSITPVEWPVCGTHGIIERCHFACATSRFVGRWRWWRLAFAAKARRVTSRCVV